MHWLISSVGSADCGQMHSPRNNHSTSATNILVFICQSSRFRMPYRPVVRFFLNRFPGRIPCWDVGERGHYRAIPACQCDRTDFFGSRLEEPLASVCEAALSALIGAHPARRKKIRCGGIFLRTLPPGVGGDGDRGTICRDRAGRGRGCAAHRHADRTARRPPRPPRPAFVPALSTGRFRAGPGTCTWRP